MKSLNEINELLHKGHVGPALTAMVQVAQDRLADQKELRNSVISLLARHHQLQTKRNRGLLTDAEAQISENQLLYSSLEMVDILREELNGRETVALQPSVMEQHRYRILLFTANPQHGGQLNLEREIREIENALARAKLRERFEFIPATATRPRDLMRRILEVRPQFVQFSGHGTREGLQMLNDNDELIQVAVKPLAEVFKLFREVIGCVLLNACYSEPQAKQIREYIPYVIGTTHQIEDDLAIEFSSRFYAAIGEGYDIAFAYEYARIGIELEGGGALSYAMEPGGSVGEGIKAE